MCCHRADMHLRTALDALLPLFVRHILNFLFPLLHLYFSQLIKLVITDLGLVPLRVWRANTIRLAVQGELVVGHLGV